MRANQLRLWFASFAYVLLDALRRIGPICWCPATRAPGQNSLVDLQTAIHRYLDEHHQRPKPFVWTADPDRIIAKVTRGHQTLASND